MGISERPREHLDLRCSHSCHHCWYIHHHPGRSHFELRESKQCEGKESQASPNPIPACSLVPVFVHNGGFSCGWFTCCRVWRHAVHVCFCGRMRTGGLIHVLVLRDIQSKGKSIYLFINSYTVISNIFSLLSLVYCNHFNA